MTVAITFRTTDNAKWGAGEGAPLSATEVDLNFWALKQAVDVLQADMPDASVGIDNFSVSGSQFWVLLTDGTQLGPYDLPVVTWTFRGTWTSETSYTAGDVVNYGTGVYYVLTTHTSNTTFDPNANDGEGNDYYSIMIQLESVTIPTGGTAGQYLQKASSTDFDAEWVDPPGVADELSVALDYSTEELIANSSLSSDPSSAWTINSNTWSPGVITSTYSGSQYTAVEIPITNLEIGSWYILSITGTIRADFRWIDLPFASPNQTYMSGNGSHIFQATSTGGTLTIDAFNYTIGYDGTITSVSMRKLAALPSPVTVSNGVNDVMSLGVNNNNIAIGEDAMAFPQLPGEGYNVAVGRGALSSTTLESAYNIAIGDLALANAGGAYNIAIGYQAAPISESGAQNVAIGFMTLRNMLTAYDNVIIGYYGANKLTTGWYNVGIGSYVFGNLVTGSNNTAIGYDAAPYVISDDNTCVGYQAGIYITTGSGNTMIGSSARVSVGTVSNSIAIGSNAVATENNVAQIGNASVTKLLVGTKAIGLPRHLVLAGGAAGAFTVTGITTADRIDEVIYYPASYDVIDLTAEFSISGLNTITNAGGTATTGGKLIVRYTSLS